MLSECNTRDESEDHRPITFTRIGMQTYGKVQNGRSQTPPSVTANALLRDNSNSANANAKVKIFFDV